jgi:hypothetical protein
MSFLSPFPPGNVSDGVFLICVAGSADHKAFVAMDDRITVVDVMNIYCFLKDIVNIVESKQ